VLKFRDYDRSWQTSTPRSDEIERKVGDIMNSEDQNNDYACTATESRLGSVMSQREVQILTTLFPKAAQTLAGVLCNRSDGF
jgi:hypothetical protein